MADFAEQMGQAIADYRRRCNLPDHADITVVAPMVPEIATWEIPPHVNIRALYVDTDGKTVDLLLIATEAIRHHNNEPG